MPSADGRCDGCGAQLGTDEQHSDGCPAVTVRVVDKRQEKRQLAELARLEAEIAARLQAEQPMEQMLADADASAQAAAVQDARARIAELRALDRALGKDEEQQLLAAQAIVEAADVAEQGEEPIYARTAFLVVVMPNGETKAYADPNVDVDVEHEASFDEMYAACALVQRDIDAAITSKHVIFGINVAGQALVEKKQAQSMAQRLAAGGRMPGMPPVPGRR